MVIGWGMVVKHVGEEQEAGAGLTEVQVGSDESVVEQSINPLIGNMEVAIGGVSVRRRRILETRKTRKRRRFFGELVLVFRIRTLIYLYLGLLVIISDSLKRVIEEETKREITNGNLSQKHIFICKFSGILCKTAPPSKNFSMLPYLDGGMEKFLSPRNFTMWTEEFVHASVLGSKHGEIPLLTRHNHYQPQIRIEEAWMA
ncbi:unnamed protein product [Fraxinus pennsylvanica]|uniref:Uncharacterized protein n=1 Tax=Fraxinus pennsylvanica TaxID=56036 RepID=A0AAD2AE38_9LAMI|nr:unnamed protein product [Fraxinus pennsylvanica]